MTGCELVATAAFCALVARDGCLPTRHLYLWPALYAISRQESGGKPYALRDETRGVEVKVRSTEEAVAYVRRHPTHKYGAGLMQITGDNLVRHFGQEWWRVAFDPCRSLRAGADHFARRDMPRAFASYNGSGEAAKIHAMRVTAHLDTALGRLEQARPVPASPSLPAPACGRPPPAWHGESTARYRACLRGQS